MAISPDEQIVIWGRGAGQHVSPLFRQSFQKRRVIPDKPRSGADPESIVGFEFYDGFRVKPGMTSFIGWCASGNHSAATILPPSHLNIEKLGELRSPVLS